jgi:hypothetical protein
MADVSVKQLADVVKTDVGRLLEQLAEAGVKGKTADSSINDEEKSMLLSYLRRSHAPAGGAAAVPVTAELVTFDGELAIAFALVSIDPETGVASRSEVWVVTREDCEVRYFAPRQR